MKDLFNNHAIQSHQLHNLKTKQNNNKLQLKTSYYAMSCNYLPSPNRYRTSLCLLTLLASTQHLPQFEDEALKELRLLEQSQVKNPGHF